MVRIELPLIDSTLLLQPRFADSSVALQILAAILGLAPLILMAWLYRWELHLVRPRAARCLLGLRLAVVVLILVLVEFQPVVARTATIRVPGRVLIALDLSDSMNVTDQHRPLVEKLKIARALKITPDGSDARQLDAWIREAEQSGQVTFPFDGRGTNDVLRQQFDLTIRRIDELTRGQTARRILNADGLNLLDAISRRHQVEIVGFTGTLTDLTAEQLASATAAGGSGAVTDLRGPLARALEHGTDAAPTLAVVLLTDGQHNESVSPADKAAELGQQHVPIYPIAIGARTAPTDIIVTAVQAPTTVFKGSDVAIEVRVQVNGLSERDLTVELQHSGRAPLTERVRHDGSDRAYTIRFQTRLDDVGTQVLTATAKPAPEESRIENNTRAIAVNVADDKAKVLLIDGEARWEYHYLASALARDHGTEAHSVVFAQPRLGRLSDGELAKLAHPARQLPAEADAFDAYDCIILGDVTPEQLPPDDRLRLERYVAERGGTLVIVAGQLAMPAAYFKVEADPLTKLLPISEPHVVRSPVGFPVVLTAEGKTTGFLHLEATPDENEVRWTELPWHYWGMFGKAKPGATVLASYRDELAAEPSDRGAWEKANGLIVRQNYGFGRVLYVGLESTWRWRFKVGDTYHHRFWGQAIRWAASDKPLLAGNEFLRFGPRKPVVPQGQSVDLVVRLNESARRLTPESLAAVRIFRRVQGRPEEAVALVTLTRPESRPRELEAKLNELPPGQYSAELVIPDLGEQLRAQAAPAGQVGPMRAAFTIAPRGTSEMSELALNLPLLEELAAKSGGTVFTPETAGQLGDLLMTREATRSEYRETRLWRSWITLFAFLVLLTLEWGARKWSGLP